VRWLIEVANKEDGMTAAEFLRNGWTSGVVTGVVVGYVTLRMEPFKSHVLLAALAAVVVGILAGVIEVLVRKIAQRRTRQS
jgi:F0F1-type ATP synthase assembly protein I